MKLEQGRIYMTRSGGRALVLHEGGPIFKTPVFIDQLGFEIYVSNEGLFVEDSSTKFDLVRRHPDCKNVKNFKLKNFKLKK